MVSCTCIEHNLLSYRINPFFIQSALKPQVLFALHIVALIPTTVEVTPRKRTGYALCLRMICHVGDIVQSGMNRSPRILNCLYVGDKQSNKICSVKVWTCVTGVDLPRILQDRITIIIV